MSDFNAWLKQINRAEPATVEGLNNTSFFYYQHKLINMIFSIFKFDNMPATWSRMYFLNHLFIDGVICVTDTTAGVLPLQTGVCGVNYFNEPTNFIIDNIALGHINGKIDEDGILIYLESMESYFYTIIPLVTRYATLLAECDGSLQTTLINSRVAHVFYANSTNQLKTYQKMYDEISKGKPAVFVRKTGEDGQNVLFNNVKQSFVGQEILDVRNTLMSKFLTEIGINNANTDKKERLISDEVNANNGELKANIDTWYHNIKNGIDKVNAKYNLNIEFDYNDAVINQYKEMDLNDGGVLNG